MEKMLAICGYCLLNEGGICDAFWRLYVHTIHVYMYYVFNIVCLYFLDICALDD